VVTAGGEELRYRRMYEMVASGYGSEVAKEGKEPVVAWRGLKLSPGMIAVDPDLIPLGSRVYVTGYSHPNLPQGGFVGLAADVGSAIQGNRIDIYIEGTRQEVWSFGNQKTKVYLLSSE
jgi:3D (Asp-Asp-Asp) domain-containing protein